MPRHAKNAKSGAPPPSAASNGPPAPGTYVEGTGFVNYSESPVQDNPPPAGMGAPCEYQAGTYVPAYGYTYYTPPADQSVLATANLAYQTGQIHGDLQAAKHRIQEVWEMAQAEASRLKDSVQGGLSKLKDSFQGEFNKLNKKFQGEVDSLKGEVSGLKETVQGQGNRLEEVHGYVDDLWNDMEWVKGCLGEHAQRMDCLEKQRMPCPAGPPQPAVVHHADAAQILQAMQAMQGEIARQGKALGALQHDNHGMRAALGELQKQQASLLEENGALKQQVYSLAEELERLKQASSLEASREPQQRGDSRAEELARRQAAEKQAGLLEANGELKQLVDSLAEELQRHKAAEFASLQMQVAQLAGSAAQHKVRPEITDKVKAELLAEADRRAEDRLKALQEQVAKACKEVQSLRDRMANKQEKKGVDEATALYVTARCTDFQKKVVDQGVEFEKKLNNLRSELSKVVVGMKDELDKAKEKQEQVQRASAAATETRLKAAEQGLEQRGKAIKLCLEKQGKFSEALEDVRQAFADEMELCLQKQGRNSKVLEDSRQAFANEMEGLKTDVKALAGQLALLQAQIVMLELS